MDLLCAASLKLSVVLGRRLGRGSSVLFLNCLTILLVLVLRPSVGLVVGGRMAGGSVLNIPSVEVFRVDFAVVVTVVC